MPVQIKMTPKYFDIFFLHIGVVYYQKLNTQNI